MFAIRLSRVWKCANQKPSQSPWKSGEGPPDLEKILKATFERLNLFGKKKSTERKTATKKRTLSIILGVLLGGYLTAGIYIVEPAEQAVVTRFGRYVRTEGPGPHWLPPLFESQQTVNVERQNTTRHGGLMLTEDENIVSVEVVVQYLVQDAKDFLFNATDPIDSLKQATESALRQVIGHSTLDSVLTSGRAQIATDIKKQIETILGHYRSGLLVSDVAMQPAKAPEQVKSAFDDVIKAREEEVSFVNKAEAYANEIEPKARGRAQRMLEEAQAYKQEAILIAEGNAVRFNLILPEYRRAPQLTQTRLFIEGMEHILSKTRKVVLDVEKGQPLLYLPLDKLTSQTREGA